MGSSSTLRLRAARIINQGRVLYIRPTPHGIRAAVKGSNGDIHIVEHRPGRGWSCTCPGFMWRGRCSHVEAVKQLLKSRLADRRP